MINANPSLPLIGQVFNGANIPPTLKAMRRWAPWKAVWNESRQKYDKIPCHPNHFGLSTKKVADWVDYDTAAAAQRLNPTKYAGLGFVLTDVKGVVGIDLDNCLVGGIPAPWAQEIVDLVDSYTEVSPSGNGLRILAVGSTANDWNNHDVGIEVYSGHTPRFLTVTGDTALAKPMAEAPADLMASLFSRYGKSALAQANVTPITMPELIPEVLLPDVEDMDVPAATQQLLLHGPDDGVGDRSGALHAAGVQLYSAGYSDAEVLSIFAASQPIMDIALSHRRQDPDRALAYLWVEHCQKAKPKATTRADVLADFDDVSQLPEVVASAKKAVAAEASRDERFKLETAAEFIVRRKATWLVKGVLPQANFGVFYGASGSGKSFLVFDLAAAVARGVEWRGHRVTQAKVCWVAAEGQEDMRKRVQGYCMANSIAPTDLDIKFISNAPNLLEVEDVKALIKQIKRHGHFDLVVIDTLAQVMPGGNENSGEDMGRVMGYCKEITRQTGAMVAPVHHSGKDESRGARGWSGLRAACDFEFEVIRVGEDRVATITKMKGGADGGEFGFRLETIVVGHDEDGDDETTCVVQFTDSSRKSLSATAGPKGDGLKEAMGLAETLMDMGDGKVTANELVKAVAAARPAPPPDVRDQRESNARRDLKKLIEKDFLVQDATGVVRLSQRHAPDRRVS